MDGKYISENKPMHSGVPVNKNYGDRKFTGVERLIFSQHSIRSALKKSGHNVSRAMASYGD